MPRRARAWHSDSAGQGGKVLFLRQDVADEASWKEIVAAALAHFGKLHILVNNAGTIARQGIVDTTVEAWNRTLAVNLTGAMLGMKHCAPAIRDSGGGSIINISSTAGLTAHDDAAYTASKWGLRGLTKTAVLQFSQWNIRVNSIHPGQIADTGFFRSGGEAFAHAARIAIPMHRQGTPKECADLVLFLASDEFELYQRRRDRDRRRLYRRRHGEPAQPRARRFRRRPQLTAAGAALTAGRDRLFYPRRQRRLSRRKASI